jgi:thiol-disulfide isomerase/thioredoxin
MNKIYIFYFAAIFFFSCSASSSKEGNTKVSGTILEADGSKLNLDELKSIKSIAVDSVILTAEGNFSFNVQVEQQSFYRLRLSENKFIVLILSPNENVEVSSNASTLEYSYKVQGSVESERLQKLNKKEYGFYVTNDSLKRELTKHQQTRNVNEYINAMNVQAGLAEKRTNYIKSFIDENPASLTSLAAVERLDRENDFDYFLKVAEALKKSNSDSEYYINFNQRIKEWGKLAIGAEAPNITLNNPEGKPLSLADLRGKVVLIDFWASWCRPCRAENPNVVRVYNKYNSKGFEVFSVSLDKNFEGWVNAIQTDGLVWKNHVSDLQYWQSAVVPLYDIKGIPLTLLLDQEGKIIVKNLRGQALDEKLAQIFGF